MLDSETPAQPEHSPTSASKGGLFESLFKDAYEHMHQQKYREAVSLFEDCAQHEKILSAEEKSMLHSQFGLLYFLLGDYRSAHYHEEKAVGYDAANDQAYAVLGKIAVAEFRFSDARAWFTKISAENPAGDLGQCLVCIKVRDTVGAQKFLHTAADKISPTDKEYKVYATYLHLLQGATKQACASARKLLTECVWGPFLMLVLGEIFMTAGSFGEAAKAAQKVRAVCQENDAAYALLAHTYYAEQSFDAAQQYGEHAVALNPRNAYAKTVLMKCASRKGNYETAEQLGRQTLHDSPEYSLGHANLGDVYFVEGRYELAEVEYEETEQLMNSATKGARLRQARMKFVKADYAGAAEILEHLIDEYHTYYDDAMCDLLMCYDILELEDKKEELLDKMQMRKSFYYRTEKLLEEFA